MSKISVLKPNGQWATPICGLDKVHLMKRVVQCELENLPLWKNPGLDEDDPYFEEFIRDFYHTYLPETEINLKSVYRGQLTADPLDKFTGKYVNWKFFQEKTKIDISKAKVFKMRLVTLQDIAKHDDLLRPIFDALIKAADIPSPTPTEYCLTFKFEAE